MIRQVPIIAWEVWTARYKPRSHKETSHFSSWLPITLGDEGAEIFPPSDDYGENLLLNEGLRCRHPRENENIEETSVRLKAVVPARPGTYLLVCDCGLDENGKELEGMWTGREHILGYAIPGDNEGPANVCTRKEQNDSLA